MSDLRQAAVEVAEKIISAGYQCYFAGGCVRDKLLGEEPNDFDLVTSALPEEVMRLFRGQSRTVGAHFGVVLVFHRNYSFDVATFRQDGEYHDARHPDSVVFSDAVHDAERRDFTVNGLFEHPLSHEIIDYVGGLEDLDKRQIRAIGDPKKRFSEDALRLLRAVRFSVTKGFEIEQGTYQAICDYSHLLSHISVERIREEWDRIMLSPARRLGIDVLVKTGLMSRMIPELLDLIDCEQPPEYHPEGDVYTHTMIMLDQLEEDAPLPLILAVLFHDIGKPPSRSVDETGRIRFFGHAKLSANMAGRIMDRLRYAHSIRDDVVSMVSRHMDFINVSNMRQSTLRKFVSSPLIEQELELHRVDCMSSNGNLDNYHFVKETLKDYENRPLMPPPFVTGDDLIQMGLKPGKQFKTILEKTFNQQLEGAFINKEQAMKAVLRKYGKN